MKKEYKHTTEAQGQKEVGEPAVEYGTYQERLTDAHYDIPKEYLLQRIAQSEKDIQEGRITRLSEIKKKPIL